MRQKTFEEGLKDFEEVLRLLEQAPETFRRALAKEEVRDGESAAVFACPNCGKTMRPRYHDEDEPEDLAEDYESGTTAGNASAAPR